MGKTAKDMDEKLTHLVETAIKIKEAFSNDPISLQIYEDSARATITVNAMNDAVTLIQMADGFEMRLVPVENELEIRLYKNLS